MSRLIKQGIPLAVGVFAGNALIVPMISGRDVSRGILVGFVAAALVLVVYSLAAVFQSGKPGEAEKKT